MSGQQIGAAVGFVVGAYFGYPQLGAMIGGAIGGAIDPTKIKGVQLGDLQAQASLSGNAIAIVFGTCVAKGCRVISQSPFRIRKETDDGKGSGTEVTNEVAYQDFTIEVCESSQLRGTSVSAILVVWQDGQIVYDARPDPLISRADSAKWKRGVTFYYGNEDQEPDPTEESYVGVDQVPAYRGKCRMVFANRNISKYSNRIPQFECLVSSCSELESGGNSGEYPYEFVAYSSAVLLGQNADTWADSESATSGLHVETLGGRIVVIGGSQIRYSDDFFQTSTSVPVPWGGAPTLSRPIKTASGRIYVAAADEFVYYTDDGGATWNSIDTGGTDIRIVAGDDQAIIAVEGTSSTFYVSTDGASFGAAKTAPVAISSLGYGDGMFMFGGSTYHWTMDQGSTFTPVSVPAPGGDTIENRSTFRTSSGAWLLYNRVNSNTATELIARSVDGQLPFAYVTTPSLNSDGGIVDGFAERSGVIVSFASTGGVNPAMVFLKSTDDGETWSVVNHGYGSSTSRPNSVASFESQSGLDIPDAPGYAVSDGAVVGPEFSAEICSMSLAEIVEKISGFCQIPPAEVVTTELEAISVRGYTIQSHVNGRGALDPLGRTFLFDFPEFDSAIRCHRRGSTDIDMVLDPGNLLDIDDPEDDDQVRGQEVEFPKRHHLRYIAADADYVFTDAVAESKSPDVRVVGESSVEAPVSLTSDEAAQIADIQRKVIWTEREDTRKFGVPLECIELVGGSIIELEQRRFRVDADRIEDGAIFLERAAYDRVAAYESNATGTVVNPSTPPPSTLIGPTLGALMNLPGLRPEDDRPGLYAAGTGALEGWYGYTIETTTDPVNGYTLRGSPVTARATIGVLTAPLPAADRDTTDEFNTLSLRLYAGELNSITDAQFHSGGNAAAILYPDGTAEIVQFRDAVETAEREYDLSHINHGRLDTAIADHATGAMFVLLNNAIRFLDLTPADLGQTITYRLASLGTALADNGSQPITISEFESQREWSVANLQAVRDGSDNVTVTWDGRPPLGTNVQPQHHAAFVGYQVTYTDGVDSFTKTIARTPLVIVAGIVQTDEVTTHTYTADEQTADFGSVPASLDISVVAVNTYTGAGPATGTTV